MNSINGTKISLFTKNVTFAHDNENSLPSLQINHCELSQWTNPRWWTKHETCLFKFVYL